tara:strand:+ start:2776 stop:3012 length:237 start_codon:yes stop_codon:yes gene_type:complete
MKIKTKRVELLRDWLEYKTGQRIDVNEDTAGWLKRQGIANFIAGRPPRKIETAAIGAVASEHSTQQYESLRPQAVKDS